jgi:DUF1680 family protein
MPSLPSVKTLSWMLLGSAWFVLPAFCFGTGLVDTSGSSFAKERPTGLSEVRWTEGFWADRFELCRTQTIPSMWSLMGGTNRTHFYENFRIAAGLKEGVHRGASFNDGDFYKWLEAAAATLAVRPDAELDQRLDEIITVIARAQRDDGYLHTPVVIRQRNGSTNAQPFQDRLQFEMYNMGHLLTAACVHFRATGKTNLLAVARRTADFLCDKFREPTPDLARNSICPSHYMGMVELYRVTRESRYLEMAKTFLAMRNLVPDGTDDNQDRIPFTQQTNAMGHAVRANYLYAGAADLFAETGDPALMNSLAKIWTNVMQQKLYVTGACGALYDGASPDAGKDQKNITRVHQAYGREYQLPNATAHNETCANIGNVLWNWRMYLLTGEARYVDVIELALYNSVLSGMDLAGTNFFYVNPLRSVEPLPVPLRWQHKRLPFVSSFCCPPNLARTIAEVNQYAYSLSAGAVTINLYGGSKLSTTLPGGDRHPISLAQETDYPWNGRVRVTMEQCGSVPFAVRLRLPGWCRGATLRLNDQLLDSTPGSAGYLEVRRTWRPNDALLLDLPMPTQLIESNPLVEECYNQVAVKRGPLVYCLESPDLSSPTLVSAVLVPDKIDLLARYDRRLLGGVVSVEGQGFTRAEADWHGKLYRELERMPLRPIKLRLIPYFAWANRGPSDMSVWLPLTTTQ